MTWKDFIILAMSIYIIVDLLRMFPAKQGIAAQPVAPQTDTNYNIIRLPTIPENSMFPSIYVASKEYTITLPENTIELHGKAAILNNESIVVTRMWQQISGPRVELGIPVYEDIKIYLPIAATYVFRYNVTNNLEQRAYENITINVLAVTPHK